MASSPGAPAAKVTPAATDTKFAHFTPVTVKSDLDASEERASKRKAEYQLEVAVKRQKAALSGSPLPPPPKNKGGRPPSQNLKPPPSGPTVLRKSRPVKIWIDMDAWQWIFEFCPVDFLLKARTVCSGFRHALKSPFIWQKARMNTLSPSHPPCPPDLTEMQYADLLTGLGCQSKGCGNKKARKTYWAFQRRWCDTCLHKNVIENEAADVLFSAHLQHYRGCVPQAVFDSWRHYQWIGSPLDIPSWARPQAFTTPAYSLSDLENLHAEVNALNAPAPDGTRKDYDQIIAFFDAKRDANDAKMAPLKLVENWEKETERKRIEANKAVKAQRADFYAEKAAKMEPPVERSELEALQCFKKAVAITRLASERSWFVLAPKVLEERKARVVKIAEVLEAGKAGDLGPMV